MVRSELMKGLWIATVSAIITLASIGYAAEAEVPAWKKATPGTQAFLGDDGGGVNTATVCDTADHYRPLILQPSATRSITIGTGSSMSTRAAVKPFNTTCTLS